MSRKTEKGEAYAAIAMVLAVTLTVILAIARIF